MTTSCPASEPSPTARAPRRARRLVFRFWRAREGATAVEFALVSLPFFALMFAIIETALVFWTTQVLETAVADAARGVYTGQFQESFAGQSDGERVITFRNQVCDRVVALFNCRANLQVTVRAAGADGFSVDLGAILDEDGNLEPDASSVAVTAAGEIVIVRAALLYPIFFMETFGAALSGGPSAPRSNGRLIVATAAFRNEPF